MEKKKVDLKETKGFMPISITPHFETMEQKLLFEALVLPDIIDVLDNYATLLGCASHGSKITD